MTSCTYWIQFHKFGCCVFSGLIQCLELDVWWNFGVIYKWTRNCIQIVSSYSNKRSPPTRSKIPSTIFWYPYLYILIKNRLLNHTYVKCVIVAGNRVIWHFTILNVHVSMQLWYKIKVRTLVGYNPRDITPVKCNIRDISEFMMSTKE